MILINKISFESAIKNYDKCCSLFKYFFGIYIAKWHVLKKNSHLAYDYNIGMNSKNLISGVQIITCTYKKI
jgi:hypothetical protein